MVWFEGLPAASSGTAAAPTPGVERGTEKRPKGPLDQPAGTAGAETQLLSALAASPLPPPPPSARALRLLGAHSAPPRRPGAAFRTRCVWTAPPGAQPPSGRGRGGG